MTVRGTGIGTDGDQLRLPAFIKLPLPAMQTQWMHPSSGGERTSTGTTPHGRIILANRKSWQGR